MAKQLFWEDVEEGTEITTLEKQPTTQQLVRWAGASGDFYQIHYDKDFALGNCIARCYRARRLEERLAGAATR